jgi:choice-of-anchor B domain-containing protein
MKPALSLFALLILFGANLRLQSQPFPALNFTMIGHINPETGLNMYGDKYSGCWGWYQPAKKKEYAIACAQSGTYFVDVTNPATPTVSAYRAGAKTAAVWREVKTYQNYCYVICDDPGNNSFQIFDMQYLPDSVKKVYDSKALFSRGHTLWVDGDKLYVASVTYSTSSYSSMNVYSLANPASPVLLRSLAQDYPFISRVHDMFVRRDTIFASCENQGLFVFRLTASNTFTQMGSLTGYPNSGFNHSSAWTPDGKTLVFTDEVPNSLPLKVANVSNLGNIQILASTNQFPQTTPHNPFIVNNQYCFMSSYEEGLQLYDISAPATPSLVGYFDTYPQGGGNTGTWGDPYEGQWGCYPFFPSKMIFALDQTNGIFMLSTHHYILPNPVGIRQTSVPDHYELQLFPNPAHSSVTFNIPPFEAESQLHLKIYDVSGKIILEKEAAEIKKTGTAYRQVDLGCMDDGIYFLNISSDSGFLSTKKLVISANDAK